LDLQIKQTQSHHRAPYSGRYHLSQKIVVVVYLVEAHQSSLEVTHNKTFNLHLEHRAAIKLTNLSSLHNNLIIIIYFKRHLKINSRLVQELCLETLKHNKINYLEELEPVVNQDKLIKLKEYLPYLEDPLKQRIPSKFLKDYLDSLNLVHSVNSNNSHQHLHFLERILLINLLLYLDSRLRLNMLELCLDNQTKIILVQSSLIIILHQYLAAITQKNYFQFKLS
jgi:hypothetical protein